MLLISLRFEHVFKIIQIDGFISRRRKKSKAIFGKANALDRLVVVIQRYQALSLRQIPNSNLPIVRARDEFIESEWALSQHADAI